KATPIRIVAPRGRGAEGRHAAQIVGPIVERLERYFDMPCPYPKVDLLAIPVTNWFGAMENPGLITYGARILLAKPHEEAVGRRRGLAGTTAHELAHYWFGDLVTLAWWNDTWLNEAFATWMAAKIIDEWKPEWDDAAGRTASRSGVMSEDSLVSTRKI